MSNEIQSHSVLREIWQYIAKDFKFFPGVYDCQNK